MLASRTDAIDEGETQRTMKLDAVTLENREITIIIVTSVGADQGKGSQSS